MTHSLNFMSLSMDDNSLSKEEVMTALYLESGWMSVITGSLSLSPFRSESSRLVQMKSTSLVLRSLISTFFSFLTRERIESEVRPR